MKKIFILIYIISILFMANKSYAGDPAEKLARGLTNVALCPLEIVHGMREAKAKGKEAPSFLGKSKGIDSALIWGIPNGLLRMGVRAVVGVYEVATFAIPFPSDYKPMLTDVMDMQETEIFIR